MRQQDIFSQHTRMTRLFYSDEESDSKVNNEDVQYEHEE